MVVIELSISPKSSPNLSPQSSPWVQSRVQSPGFALTPPDPGLVAWAGTGLVTTITHYFLGTCGSPLDRDRAGSITREWKQLLSTVCVDYSSTGSRFKKFVSDLNPGFCESLVLLLSAMLWYLLARLVFQHIAIYLANCSSGTACKIYSLSYWHRLLRVTGVSCYYVQ